MEEPKEFPITHAEENKLGPMERPDIRVAVIGNVDSGKSTLVGVLARCVSDDGRGSARSLVFNYSHEQTNGRTSSIAQEIMGFSSHGEQVQPRRLTDTRNRAWGHIVEHSDKVLTFLDLCGHEKYLKTTLFGLVGMMPDYAMIVIGSNMGMGRMTKEHIGLALSLKVPMFFVMTKIDIAPENVYNQNLEFLQKVLRSPAAGNRLPVIVNESTDMEEIHGLLETKVCPIFCVSNVTGEGVAPLRRFLFSLEPRVVHTEVFGTRSDPPEFLIDAVFNVTGIGVVLSGLVRAGTIRVNSTLMLGPDKSGQYRPVTVKGIHIKRTLVGEAITGQSACFNVRAQSNKDQLKKNHLRKGMVLVDRTLCPATAWEFDAEVVILCNATTIKPNYQPIVHCGVVRQAARVISVSKDPMRSGEKGVMRFRFMFNPELLHVGSTILFREGRTKGLGVVTYVITN